MRIDKRLIIVIFIITIAAIIVRSTSNTYIGEGFDTSSTADIEAGSSTFFDWGNKEPSDDKPDVKPVVKHHWKPDPYKPVYCPTVKDKACNVIVDNNYTCRNCDITKNKDIDKYILKSSVPPCPDMSKFATKSMIKSCPDMKDYIKKTKIPPCNCPNLNDYVLKSQIPACPKCPVCPICPKPYPAYYRDNKHRDNSTHDAVANYNRGYEEGRKMGLIECEKAKETRKEPIDVKPNTQNQGIFGSIESWFNNIFNPTNQQPLQLKEANRKGPIGYGFGEFVGWGTNNPGYSLTGSLGSSNIGRGGITIPASEPTKERWDNRPRSSRD